MDALARRLPPDARLQRSRTQRVPTRIARIASLTHDLREVVLERTTCAPVMQVRAGQFAVLSVAGAAPPRPFSFARAPEDERPGEFTFLIRLVEGGAFSSWLAAADRTGATVELAAPLGRFTLDSGQRPLLCIAGGSGLSAIYALVTHAAHVGVARDVWLFYGARTQSDLALANELAALAARWHAAHRYAFVPVLSAEPANSDWAGARGFVTAEVARVAARGGLDLTACAAYVCGPPPMIDAALAMLAGAGLASEHIRRDVFDDVRSPAPIIDNRRCVLCDECLLVKPLERCIVESAGVVRNADGTTHAVMPLAPTATSGLYYNSLIIDPAVCIRCHACVDACPHGAISVTHDARVSSLRQPRRI
jgi:NAD(P)H-flavin reductase